MSVYIEDALCHFRLVVEWCVSHGEIDPRLSQIAEIAGGALRFTVTAATLNIRTGPGMNYYAMGSYKKGTVVDILETAMGWGKISIDRWICIKPIYGILAIKK